MNAVPYQTSSESPQPSPPRTAASQFFTGFSAFLCILGILVIATELSSLAVLSLSQGEKRANVHQSYYDSQPWAEQFWKEESLASPKHFSPFVIWRRSPFQGKYVNVESDGLRRTVNPSCSPEAKQVWIFGSSTLWGTGARDDQTIPSFLSQEYSRAVGPVCVKNFSEA